jgi:hypothetical protein
MDAFIVAKNAYEATQNDLQTLEADLRTLRRNQQTLDRDAATLKADLDAKVSELSASMTDAQKNTQKALIITARDLYDAKETESSTNRNSTNEKMLATRAKRTENEAAKKEYEKLLAELQ